MHEIRAVCSHIARVDLVARNAISAQCQTSRVPAVFWLAEGCTWRVSEMWLVIEWRGLCGAVGKLQAKVWYVLNISKLTDYLIFPEDRVPAHAVESSPSSTQSPPRLLGLRLTPRQNLLFQLFLLFSLFLFSMTPFNSSISHKRIYPHSDSRSPSLLMLHSILGSPVEGS